MDEIGKEQTALETQIAELGGRITGADSIAGNISSAQALLAELRKRLDQPVSWELKRCLIEVLVAGVRVDTIEESGVKQTRTTVTYRFSQPDRPMPLVLPQSYITGSVVRIPTQLNTVGDHIRKRRLGRKMLQKEVAEQLGVCEPSVYNWERNASSPEIRYMPAIIQFLGYNWATTHCRQRARWPSTWSASGPAWGCRRKIPPDGLAWTPALWRGGSAANGSPKAYCWSA